MRLVVDVRLINSSGIGTYIKNIVPQIIDFYTEVVLLGDTQEIKTFEWSTKVTIIDFSYKTYGILEQLYYPLVIPKCDVFWSPHFNTPLFGIRSKNRVVTIHDVNHLSNPTYFNVLKRIWAKCLYKNAIKKSDQIITVSEFSKSEILKFFSVKEKKINVIHCGVQQEFEIPKNNNFSFVNTSDKYFLYVGNIKPHKNLIILLKAYNLLEESIKNKYKLLIIGKKDGFITGDKGVFDFITANNLEKNIDFTGYITDQEIPVLYKNATVFIFPSLYEGFGLPVLEAMVCGVPVLCSNKASLPEVGGDAVLYFDPRNEHELKDKITSTISDQKLISTLIHRGKEHCKKFDWKKSIESHIEVFKSLN